jgi:hypothetical protein
MGPSSRYFYRNRGEWNWAAQFKIKSWSEFFKSDLSLLNKLSVCGLMFTQKFFGSFQMWTKVDFVEGRAKVYHTTKIKKLGFTFYHSEKTFFLNPDENGMRLEGVEYQWPMMWKAEPFRPVSGLVESSSTRARYQMPFLGLTVDCQAILERDQGQIEIQTPWLLGNFVLTPESQQIIASRFGRP